MCRKKKKKRGTLVLLQFELATLSGWGARGKPPGNKKVIKEVVLGQENVI
jgi:hypothetical protein